MSQLGKPVASCEVRRRQTEGVLTATMLYCWALGFKGGFKKIMEYILLLFSEKIFYFQFF